MDDLHLRPLEADQFLAFLPPPQQVALGHVLECATCRQLLLDKLGPPAAAPAAARPERPDYTAMWPRVFAHAEEIARRAAAEREAADPALAELLPLRDEERRERVQQEARLRSVAVANLLLERSFAAAREDPAEGEELALLALLILGLLAPEQAPAQLVAELRARGWALVAHACWINADWPGAREGLERSEQALAEAGYATKRLGFRRTMAAFRLTESRIEEAFQLLSSAVEALLACLLPAPEGAEPDNDETET
ncbi:MAG TPA: hypothetical protein VF121_12235 [Thermoanaerobaculia bacterium]|nr:hypothetical protein [Thermoanaerobaculia bacterium]